MSLCAVAAVIAGLAVPVDGDTLKIGGCRVRLVDVDAAELREPGGDLGLLAMSAILALGGGEAECRGTRHDRYGRLLARCTVATLGDVSTALLRVGAARPR